MATYYDTYPTDTMMVIVHPDLTEIFIEILRLDRPDSVFRLGSGHTVAFWSKQLYDGPILKYLKKQDQSMYYVESYDHVGSRRASGNLSFVDKVGMCRRYNFIGDRYRESSFGRYVI